MSVSSLTLNEAHQSTSSRPSLASSLPLPPFAPPCLPPPIAPEPPAPAGAPAAAPAALTLPLAHGRSVSAAGQPCTRPLSLSFSLTPSPHLSPHASSWLGCSGRCLGWPQPPSLSSPLFPPFPGNRPGGSGSGTLARTLGGARPIWAVSPGARPPCYAPATPPVFGDPLLSLL